MSEDISQNPEKLRALALERGERIERLEAGIEKLDQWLAKMEKGEPIQAHPSDLAHDARIELREALADDAVDKDNPPQPQHKEAGEKLQEILSDKDTMLGVAYRAAKRQRDMMGARGDARGEALEDTRAGCCLKALSDSARRDCHGPDVIDFWESEIRRALTAPPTVPEALERALRDIAESDITSDPEMDVQEFQSIARRALAQHSEPETDDE